LTQKHTFFKSYPNSFGFFHLLHRSNRSIDHIRASNNHNWM